MVTWEEGIWQKGPVGAISWIGIYRQISCFTNTRSQSRFGIWNPPFESIGSETPRWNATKHLLCARAREWESENGGLKHFFRDM